MTDNPSVNRCLDDKGFDHIDHALGRPVFPLRESYRNYFATGGSLASEFDRSEFWEQSKPIGDMAYFHVTEAGRIALAAHLRTVDCSRPYLVTFKGFEHIVPARSPAQARYAYFLDLSDVTDLSFVEFCASARVRLAA